MATLAIAFTSWLQQEVSKKALTTTQAALSSSQQMLQSAHETSVLHCEALKAFCASSADLPCVHSLQPAPLKNIDGCDDTYTYVFRSRFTRPLKVALLGRGAVSTQVQFEARVYNDDYKDVCLPSMLFETSPGMITRGEIDLRECVPDTWVGEVSLVLTPILTQACSEVTCPDLTELSEPRLKE